MINLSMLSLGDPEHSFHFAALSLHAYWQFSILGGNYLRQVASVSFPWGKKLKELTMSAAKTSPDAPSPSDAPMPNTSTVVCLMAPRGGGALAQHGLPAKDTHARDWQCASSSGTCQRRLSTLCASSPHASM